MFRIDMLWLTKRLQIVRSRLVRGSRATVCSGKTKLSSLRWKPSRHKGRRLCHRMPSNGFD